MQCQELDINSAQGVRLLNEICLGKQVFAKGHKLSAEDIIIFKTFGVRRVFGAIMEEFDLESSTALGIIAGKICGKNTAFKLEKNGSCKIVALSDGALMISPTRLCRFNRIYQGIVLNASEEYSLVKKHQVIAEFMLDKPIISQDDVDEIIFKLSGNVALISVEEIKPSRAALIYTKLAEDDITTKHFTSVVKKLVKETDGMGIEFATEYNSMHWIEAIADEIERSIRAGHDISFIITALPTSGVEDTVFVALNKIVDELVCKKIPVFGASDMLVAQKREHKIVVLPYNYDKDLSLLPSKVIRQVIASDKLNLEDFCYMQPAELLIKKQIEDEEQKLLIMPKNYGDSNKKANIAVVVLAAGQGKRAGCNKLLVDVGDGVPLFMRAVNAAIASDAGPVYVMIGYLADKMQEFLEDVDVNVIYNPAYQAGVKTSIELGLKSVPNFCDGVMIIPADMPNLKAEDLNKLIAKFNLEKEKQVIVFNHKGVSFNPVIWSNSLYNRAEIVPENSEQRQIFMEHADYITKVELKDKHKLLDITFPSDVDEVKSKKSI